MDLPKYADLPRASAGGRSAWGTFGEHADLGRLVLQDDAATRRGSATVRRGARFPLNAPLDLIDPPFFRRPQLRNEVRNTSDKSLDDALHDFAPQASSQWDALVHVAYRPDEFFGGHTAREVLQDRRGTIDHVAEHGIATRGVLLDLAPRLEELDASAGDPVAFGVEDLERALHQTGLALEPGDVLLLRTGFLSWYLNQDRTAREAMSDRLHLHGAGIARTEEMVEWLWNSGVSAIASDNSSVEVWPPSGGDGPFDLLHRMLLGQLGFLLGELWWLDDLAADCAATGVHEMFLVSAPLNLRGGVGSTANAIAIR